MPPPVVCFTCPAASPTTMKPVDQHLDIGPATRTDPDLVASTEALGHCSLTRSSRNLFTLPFLEARPTLALFFPVGMLHAKNPGALLDPKNSSTRSPCSFVSTSSYCSPGRICAQSGDLITACFGSL